MCLKEKAKIPKSRNHGVPEFFVIYRRTYVLNNNNIEIFLFSWTNSRLICISLLKNVTRHGGHIPFRKNFTLNLYGAYLLVEGEKKDDVTPALNSSCNITAQEQNQILILNVHNINKRITINIT